MHFEPKYYHQAVKLGHWRASIHEELQAMESNGTWSVVSLPTGKTPIGCRWIFKNKFNADGTLAHHKARLVAKGYNQREGIEFLEVFSPVAKMVNVKVLLTLVASHNWFLAQLDVNNAFLNENVYKEVYMDLPLGYHPRGKHLPSSTKMVAS